MADGPRFIICKVAFEVVVCMIAETLVNVTVTVAEVALVSSKVASNIMLGVYMDPFKKGVNSPMATAELEDVNWGAQPKLIK